MANHDLDETGFWLRARQALHTLLAAGSLLSYASRWFSAFAIPICCSSKLRLAFEVILAACVLHESIRKTLRDSPEALVIDLNIIYLDTILAVGKSL